MDYREFAPSPELAPVVARMWTLSGEAGELGDALQPVLPDGHPELVLHLGDFFARVDGDGRAERQPLALFAGQLSGPLTLRPSGRVAVVGVRFHPFGAAALLRAPQHETAGLTLDVVDVHPALAVDVQRIRSATDNVDSAAVMVQHTLAAHIDRSRVHPTVRAAAATILRTHGGVSVGTIAAHAGVSRRHLERAFLRSVGLSPKRLARIARFQRAVRVLERADGGRRGTVTAAVCGYADQSHFIREFRELAGCSPSEYLLHSAQLTGFFLST